VSALVVEDRDNLRDLLVLALIERGHEVVAVAAPGDVRAACHGVAVTLAIVGRVPPGTNRHDLCRRLRSLPGGVAGGVLVLIEPGAAVDPTLLDAGATDLLAEPVAPTLLATHLAVAEHRIRDGAARGRAATAWTAAEERLRGAVDNAPLVLFALDRAGVFTLSEGQALGALGLTPGQVVGRSVFDLYRDTPLVLALTRRALGGEACSATVEVAELVFDLSYAPRWGGDGEMVSVIGIAVDVTERERAEAALRDSFARQRDLLAAADRHTREVALLDEVRTALARELEPWVVFRTVVEAIAKTFGYTMVSLYTIEAGRLALQHQVGYHQVLDHIPLTRGVMGRVARTGEAVLLEDGRTDPDFIVAFAGIVSEICVPLRDQDRVVGVLNLETVDGVTLTVADLRLVLALSDHVNIAIGRARLHAGARASDERFRRAFDDAGTGMALVGPDGRPLRVNRALCRMLGHPEATLLATTLLALFHPDDRAHSRAAVRQMLTGGGGFCQIETRFLAAGEREVQGLVNLSLVRDDRGDPDYLIAQIQDISERKALEERLGHQAHHDPLTGLPNRRLFADRMERALASTASRPGERVAVLLVDLDGFKLVNDSLGHAAGDRVLVAAGQRLAGCLRPGETVARLGGDEFAILVERVAAARDMAALATRLIDALRPPVALDGREAFVTASVGVALATAGGAQPRDLLRDADIALYRAKAAGRATFAVFEPGMAAAMVARLNGETALRRALARGELRLHYQPEVELASGRIVGVEALVRWEHPDHGLLGPANFIDLAEETGLIVPLGEWVLREACRQASAWQTVPATASPLVVGVTLSPRQLAQRTFADQVARVLDEVGLPPRALRLEITESVAMRDGPDTRRTLGVLRELGVELAIDDFGTGYSSLGALRELPIDTLKIDQSFVRELGRDAGSLGIVRAVTSLAHDLGLVVTAEGIETEVQLGHLRRLGVDRGQGYLLTAPVDSGEMARLLAAHWGAPAPAVAGAGAAR